MSYPSDVSDAEWAEIEVYFKIKLFVDGGYKAGVIAWAKAMFGYCLEVVQRRLAKNDEHHLKTAETVILIASCTLKLRRLHPL